MPLLIACVAGQAASATKEPVIFTSARAALAPTHYLIRVPGADPERRWVKISCGHSLSMRWRLFLRPAKEIVILTCRKFLACGVIHEECRNADLGDMGGGVSCVWRRLLLASAPTAKAGCPKGAVDAVGFQ
ncbi:hypothetical protein NKJ72_00655 [Mesorhizobium sp. M0045]|uniref:hypothetical protein n=1 Tax=Mesorhizobium sp. M0045 TaxID=2956857 RepID=UPI0033363B91